MAGNLPLPRHLIRSPENAGFYDFVMNYYNKNTLNAILSSRDKEDAT